MDKDETNSHKEDAPPILKTWKNLYFAVIANLVLLILLFYLFKEFYS